MTVIIGFVGAVLGALVGSIATYLTTRSNMVLTLKHSYDQTLQGKRLESYQELFHISRCLPRYWPPMEKQPDREDLRKFMRDFHDWYFGESAGGMFLTPAAKTIYMLLMNQLAEAAFTQCDGCEDADSPLPVVESQVLRNLASELRHQLAEDVGAANPPRLRWVRPSPQPLLPTIDKPDHSSAGSSSALRRP